MDFNQTQSYPYGSYYSIPEATSYHAATNIGGTIPYWDLSLQRGDIRLIVLEPDDDPRKPIECTLMQVSLGDTGRYVALSYRWGDPEDAMVRITISGQLFKVTKTLAHALQELRRRRFYKVWVDRICINQGNHEELAHQVERMGDIYRYAYCTMAWLGYCREPEVVIFESARSFVESLVAWGEEKHETTPQQKDKDFAEKAKTIPLSTLELQSQWTALLTVFQRDYWSRAWIIQEVAVSPQVEFFWNGQSISISELQKAIATCKALASITPEAKNLTWRNEFKHVDYLMSFRGFRESPIRLVEALIRSKRALCSNPEDRLYALKHLAADGRDTVPFPNYGESLDLLNQKTAFRLIKMYLDGDMVVFPCHFSDTWVPQWHNPQTWNDERINKYLTGQSNFVAERSKCESGSSTIVKRWKATKGSRISCTLLHHNAWLKVYVKRIGRITQCSTTAAEANSDGPGELAPVSTYGAHKSKRLIALCWLLYDLLPNNKYPKAKAVKVEDIHFLLTKSVRKPVRKSVPKFYNWLFCLQNLQFKIDGVPLANWFCADSVKSKTYARVDIVGQPARVNQEMSCF
ncbi:heterokaryon incompatibility protein [Colletotrichum tabaci]|uniref:Heterokaryon incompatibility protein n=1 Tax=Colletotrichum tabaci TaxID=1209068 RepID=A0AAV9T7V2_9PEZI